MGGNVAVVAMTGGGGGTSCPNFAMVNGAHSTAVGGLLGLPVASGQSDEQYGGQLRPGLCEAQEEWALSSIATKLWYKSFVAT
eukprot:1162051-Pelagomonas_calceolata.AAC.16